MRAEAKGPLRKEAIYSHGVLNIKLVPCFFFYFFFKEIVIGEFDDRPLHVAEKEDGKRKKRRGHSILDEEVTEHGETQL